MKNIELINLASSFAAEIGATHRDEAAIILHAVEMQTPPGSTEASAREHFKTTPLHVFNDGFVLC